MREIKFRAWEKHTQKMYDVREIKWGYNNGLRKIVAFTYIYRDLDFTNRKRVLEVLFNKINLMQFTGLKDKKGKDMYEGDIVEEKNESEIKKYVIEWDISDCCFYPKSIFKTMIEQRMSSNYTEFEVIGNIYENPELLNSHD